MEAFSFSRGRGSWVSALQGSTGFFDPAASQGSATGGARVSSQEGNAPPSAVRPHSEVLDPDGSSGAILGFLAGPHAPHVSLKTKRAGTRAPEGAPDSGGRKVRGLPARRRIVLQKSMGVVRPHEAAWKGDLPGRGQGTTRG